MVSEIEKIHFISSETNGSTSNTDTQKLGLVRNASILEDTIFFNDYYYPKRLEGLKSEEIAFQESVWQFKSGNNTQWAKRHLSVLVDEGFSGRLYGKCEKRDVVLCAIPASNQQRTQQRYQTIISEVANEQGFENGFGYITSKTSREPKHFGLGHFDAEKHIEIHPEVSGKHILLFDDVFTSGDTFNQVKRALLVKGAKSVTGIFIAKTKSQLK